jgi:hypothetical protein
MRQCLTRQPVVVIALLPLAAACAAGPRAADAPHTHGPRPWSEKALPIPADLAPHVEASAELGRIIYFVDKASAIGTDVLRDKVPDFRQRGLGAWLTLREEGTRGDDSVFWVLFVTDETPARLAFRIRVPIHGDPRPEEVSPPTALDDAVLRFLRARQSALAAVPETKRGINPVLLPGSAVGRPDSILVYLLAAEHRRGEIVFGIHYRVLVSADGATVQQVVPLSQAPLVASPPPESLPRGAVRLSSMVSHLVTDWPLETHVFVSLLHKSHPVYVVTQRGTWLVIGDKIILVEDGPPRPPR